MPNGRKRSFERFDDEDDALEAVNFILTFVSILDPRRGLFLLRGIDSADKFEIIILLLLNANKM